MKSNRPIRRSQLIAPFGVGALVNFPNDESWMTAGLDTWPKAFEECPPEWKIVEERLQKRLGKTHFRLPPDFRERSDQSTSDLAYQKIPYLRFPRWHYCPKCGTMRFLSNYGKQERCSGSRFESGFSCKKIPERSRPILIPSRFITICSKGHIEDFPFMEWVHGDKEWNHDNHQLRIMPGRSTSSLAGTYIKCSCGAGRSMANSFSPNSLSGVGYFCSGLQPWLGRVSGVPGDCGENLRVVQRGASNVYFPDVKSSIYIPISGEEENTRKINKQLDDPKIWSLFEQGIVNGKIDRMASDLIAGMRNLDPNELYNAAQKKVDALNSKDINQEADLSDETMYRYSEYKAITEGVGGETTDLFTESVDIKNYHEPWSSYFDQIILVKKLRETRVLSGFSRLLPSGDNNDVIVQQLASDENIKWLPGITVHGEGIFLKFDNERIEEWASQENVIKRINDFNKEHNNFRQERNMEPVSYSAKFMLLHTFSHLLINQLSYESGYGSSSIRERIYCDMDDTDKKMSAILIYTASGDSEGTLGGLVRQGEPDRLPEILNNTLNKSKWCTNDPICIESKGQGINNSNLAACHSCALIAETSCEHGNRYLDRAMLIGTIKDESLGFFNSSPIIKE